MLLHVYCVPLYHEPMQKSTVVIIYIEKKNVVLRKNSRQIDNELTSFLKVSAIVFARHMMD